MRQGQVEKFREWFVDYVSGFYGRDGYVNTNIKLKEKHSLMVCEEMNYLAGELGLDRERGRTAEVIALLHDTGRFRQFVEYRTFNDNRSVNHCLLGLEILREEKVLGELDGGEAEIIEKAIEYHGQKQLAEGLDGDCLLYCQLIRDADKLDIFRVTIEGYKSYRENPEGFRLETELLDVPDCSSEVLEAILNGRRVDYSGLRTWNDMKLLQLAWVYDVNFVATLKRMRERKFLEQVFGFLPVTESIEKLKEKIFGYVDSAIEKRDGGL